MKAHELEVVTGAFGYTGKYITRRLLAFGRSVTTLTGHPGRNDAFGGRVQVAPLSFDDPAALAKSLAGGHTLYNTYWIRFERGERAFDRAVENTRTLLRAAEQAGVRRIVHVSITNASANSPLPYFHGKGLVEEAIMRSELSYAIIRPTVIFGIEDILMNNIAWFLRRLPVFGIPGKGDYRVQPVYVDDVASLAVGEGQKEDNVVFDAVGPEVFSYEELVRLIARTVQSKARIIHPRPALAWAISKCLGMLLRDVVLTRDEVKGLMANLLVSDGPPIAPTRLTEWLGQHAHEIGTRYASELSRHYR